MFLSSVQEDLLDALQKDGFKYFLEEVNPNNGLVADSTWDNGVSSIAAVGFALACYPVGVEHGWMSRQDAVERALVTMRYFQSSPQGAEPDTTGYQGFYYHFLDLQTGQRSWNSELSTILTTLLLYGMLTAAQYFEGDTSGERELGGLSDLLYRRVNWNWAEDEGLSVRHGWLPESGFLDYRWETLYGYEILHAAPLFVHQFPQVWIDFRGVQDEPMRARGLDYFENSRRATYVHQQHAIQNPSGFEGYGEHAWELQPARVQFKGPNRSRGMDAHFIAILRVVYPAPMMVRSHPGQPSLLCLSRLRLLCLPLNTFIKPIHS